MLTPYSPFYNTTTRAYVVSFGDLFNQIYIQKKETSGTVRNTILVPISFSKKERYLTRILSPEAPNMEGDEDTTNIQIILPRIGFDLVDIQYDSQRKVNGLNRVAQGATQDPTNSSVLTRRAGTPWNFMFEMYVTAKEIDEIYQIIEQILPFFQPHFNLSIKDNKNFSFSVDAPLVFNGVVNEDKYEGDMRDGERRILVWTLSFTLKGFLYGPSTALPVIKQVETNINDMGCNPLQTTIIKVDPWDAGPDDAYGYDVQVIDYD